MECLVGNGLDADEVHLNNHNISSLTPELQFSPYLAKLFLQENNSLTILPPSFFQRIPVLQVLDLSHTSIQSLPPSIFKLCLLEELILRECSLLMIIPPEIGALKKLKLFDLEGTEIMYLPKEIGKLETLERLRVSFSTYADEYKVRNGIEHIIPRRTISKLKKLKDLSISVDPEAEWWEVELLEAILGDLIFLPDLKTLKLYLPTTKALQQFLRLERYQVPIYSSLWNFRFSIGHCEQLPFSIQLDIEENFLKLEKCVKYMNGEGCTNHIVELIRDARALYLRRHWTIENLSMLDIDKLKYCLLMECNEMQTLIDQEDLYTDTNKATKCGEDTILESLQYLAIHFMKKLQRITKGPICRSSLSHLRILALHTCPELTSIFSRCLLDNLQSLTELIVEDCPKVSCLINLEETIPWSNGPFLPNLRRVSLIDLPELVSISGGFCIAPQLDTLIVFNCMRLDYLSVMELPGDIQVIKGEIEWWDALKYGKMAWNSVFVELKRDGVLMEQLAEDTNSLQHFLELQMVPPHSSNFNNWSSLQTDQNSSRDIKQDREHVDQLQIAHNVTSVNGTRKMSTQKILNFDNRTLSQHDGTAFRMWEPPCPLNDKPHNEDADCDFKVSNHKLTTTEKKNGSSDIAKWIQLMKKSPQTGHQVPSDDGYIQSKYLPNNSLNSKHPRKRSIIKYKSRVSKERVVKQSLYDGYSWRKYGQKDILNVKYPRNYYRCSFKFTHGCCALKQVQKSTEDPPLFEVSYMGKHTCPTLLSNSCPSTATESASAITDSHFEVAKRHQVLDSDKKNSSSGSNAKWTEHVKVSPKSGFDIPPDDGYTWRKYGQHELLGAKYTSGYYICTSCKATKQVQRSDDDPSILEITYKGIHTCLRISVPNNSESAPENSDSSTETETESALSILINSAYSTTAESDSMITNSSFGLDSMKKMSGTASIQRWKKQENEIQSRFSPSFQFPLPSSSIVSESNTMISEVTENSSINLPSSTKTPQNAIQCCSQVSARKEKMGDKITELRQLVSPFGKIDTASVLLETCGYIRFLHDQVRALITLYTKQGAPAELLHQQTLKRDLRSQGLCLVPVSSTLALTNQTATDFSNHTIGEPPNGPKA